MTKTIVLLFDGTANTIRANRSNILRLYGCLEKSADQLVWYSPGVGTFGGEASIFHFVRRVYGAAGMATGWGLDHNVKQAYRFLVDRYDNGKRDGKRVQERDRLFILGFSRGAYTARVLAGFLNAFGLMETRHLNLLDQAYSAYKGVAERPDAPGDWDEMDLFYRVLRPDMVPIAGLGLFDTVASVFEWGRDGPRFRGHANTSFNPSVAAVRQALALDERRGFYSPLPWPGGQTFYGHRFKRGPSNPQDLREMWFAGVHADIGGGYPERDSGLGKVALKWMIDQTEALGLRYRKSVVNRLVLGRRGDYVAPAPMAPAQQSLNLPWMVTEIIPRRLPPSQRRLRAGLFGLHLPLGQRRLIAGDALVHASVMDRQTRAMLRSPNLPPAPAYSV